MVRTLDFHPKAVLRVLGKLFYVVTGPQAQCEVRMDHVAGPLHILLAKKEGRIWFSVICLNPKNHGVLEFACGPSLGGGPDENYGRP